MLLDAWKRILLLLLLLLLKIGKIYKYSKN